MGSFLDDLKLYGTCIVLLGVIMYDVRYIHHSLLIDFILVLLGFIIGTVKEEKNGDKK